MGPTSLILGGYAIGVLFAAATLVHVYRGGTTANDHFVAVVVTGTHLLFPTLWWGAVSAGALGLRGWGALFLVGSALVWSLFWLMDRRAEATGPLRLLGWLSQPAHAFALWSGLLLVFWAPLVLLLHWLGVAWLHPLWPGPLLLGPLGLAVWGTLHTHTHGTRVLGWRVPLPRLRQTLRIVQLSDVHASPTMTRVDLAALHDRIWSLDPDVVVLTGDLVMPFSEQEHGWLLDFVAELPGTVIANPGNHDLPVAVQLGAELSARGVHWLVNDQVVVDGNLEVAGLDFHWRHARAQLRKAVAELPETGCAARVLLVHDPRVTPHVRADRYDLVLSGHTHGGQVGGEMFGWRTTLLGLLGARDQGWYADGHPTTWTYVHRGNWLVGWPPRMGVAPEIAVFDLVPGQGSPSESAQV